MKVTCRQCGIVEVKDGSSKCTYCGMSIDASSRIDLQDSNIGKTEKAKPIMIACSTCRKETEHGEYLDYSTYERKYRCTSCGNTARAAFCSHCNKPTQPQFLGMKAGQVCSACQHSYTGIL